MAQLQLYRIGRGRRLRPMLFPAAKNSPFLTWNGHVLAENG
jgi:hypothetical protein